MKAKKEEEEKFDLKMGKLRRKLQELEELKECINSSIKFNMEKARGRGISKLAAESFIVKAEGARGELATCDREIDKINEKIVDLVMQNKGGILSFIHFLSLEKLKIKCIFRCLSLPP